ncbi:hypothetical protein [Bdellovibrio svalbardensis]|uniref:Uncharacterized protein n=1 Tax=Bdellovibrio svalbardensis TaxID=2972972 RepID=A0ABT6DIN7_9BACT|nr:hypothetical protein [Bdellovibrio svalbardensis]MDG0815794.1 hypothetical protein [Bdellovibrio svalbardensis]
MKAKLTILFTLVSLLVGLTASAKEINSALDVMTFEDSFTCQDKFPHHSFCEAVEFKPWSAADKEIVSRYLQNINDPRLKFLLQTIQEKGITKLHRVGYTSSWSNNMAQRRVEFHRTAEKAILWVNPVTHVIGFTDAFFNGTPFVDPYAKVERKQLNVFHELVHVYDIALNHISTEDGFKKAAGWEWNGKEFVIHGVDYNQVKADFSAILALVKNKQSALAYAQDRERGRTYGFPTVYGMTNSHESFAEVITYYIFDPTAESYYSKELTEYVKEVLKVDGR